MNIQNIIFVLLRLLHIVSAVSWIAIGATLTLFVAPAAVKVGESGYRYLKTLLTRTPYAKLVAPAAGITTLAGILLYLDGGGRFGPLGSAVLGIGAVFGLIATIHGGAIVGRTTTALGKVLETVPDGAQPIPAAILTQLNELATKLLGEARISLILMIVALVCMGSARYL